jgi:hypothetical protein
MTGSAADFLARLQVARAWLHAADPVIAGLIDRRPDYDPRYRLDGIPPTPDEFLTIAERWRPYRSLATLYLFRAGESTAARS